MNIVELFLGVKRPGREAKHLAPKLRMSGAELPLPNVPSWCAGTTFYLSVPYTMVSPPERYIQLGFPLA